MNKFSSLEKTDVALLNASQVISIVVMLIGLISAFVMNDPVLKFASFFGAIVLGLPMVTERVVFAIARRQRPKGI